METRSIKVTLLGGPSSGKTALAKQYVHNEFDEQYESTIGAILSSKLHLAGILELWDAAGANQYQALLPAYTRNADAILIVCDMTKDEWEKEFKSALNTYFKITPKDAVIFIVGTKKDLIEDKLLKERELALQSFVASKQMLAEIDPELANRKVHCATTSAKTGEGIKNLFDTVLFYKPKADIYSDLNKNSAKQEENAPQASIETIKNLAEKIDRISGDNDFWETKVGSYARNQGKTSPDGVNQIHEENTIKNLTDRLQQIGKDADYKCSSTSLAKWFHSYFRSRHPATEEFYGILSKLDNFSEKTVLDVTEKLNTFQEKYRPANNEKKEELSILIHDILLQGSQNGHPMHEKFLHAGAKYIKSRYDFHKQIESINNNKSKDFEDDFLKDTRKSAEKNHSSVARLHTFFNSIPDPTLNEFYGILKELEELDNATVAKAIEKLQKFRKENIEPAKSNEAKIK